MARNRRFSFVRSVIRVLFILFGAGVGNRHLAFSSQYVISDLGVNTSAIMPGNINNLGQTTGVADGGSFLCANGTFTYFTVFGTYGHTMDLNDHSQVTGWNLQTPRKGFRWSLASGAVDLGTLGGDTWGLGINDSGITVGTSTVIQGASQYMRAFRWETGNVAQLTLWQSGLQSQAFDINDNGVIVGEASNNIGTWRAVRWVNGIPENLGVMAGFTSSRAIAINNSRFHLLC